MFSSARVGGVKRNRPDCGSQGSQPGGSFTRQHGKTSCRLRVLEGAKLSWFRWRRHSCEEGSSSPPPWSDFLCPPPPLTLRLSPPSSHPRAASRGGPSRRPAEGRDGTRYWKRPSLQGGWGSAAAAEAVTERVLHRPVFGPLRCTARSSGRDAFGRSAWR